MGKRYELKNNVGASRYEFDLGDDIAVVDYERIGTDIVVLTHTGVPKRYSGQGIAAELTEAAKYYFSRTGRRIVYEYALIKDNMTVFDVERLARITSGYSAHVNLIMVNPVKERPVIGCTRAEAERFRSRLERAGVSVTIRRSMGADIEGACGQLRRRYKEKAD